MPVLAAAQQNDVGISFVCQTEAVALATLPARAAAKLRVNHMLMQQTELRATRAILYLDGAGLLQTEQGVPPPAKLARILGGASRIRQRQPQRPLR